MIQSRVLHWTCADESNLLTVVIQQTLADLESQLGNCQRHPAANLLQQNIQLGLAAWNVADPALLSATCLTIQQCRRNFPQALVLAFVPLAGIQARGMLVEAGAHLVPSHISQIPQLLIHLAPKLLIAAQCSNPLLSGILSRLPWAE